jgi:phosphonate transport system substrate-binding protein
MVDDSGMPTNPSSRRRFLLTGGAIGVTGLAGCTGGSGSGGTEEAGSGSESDTDGTNGGSGDPMLTDASAFDPANPTWEEHNYLSTALVDADYQRGSTVDLENMRNREVDEVPHGEPVQETPDNEDEWLDPDTLVFTESPSEDVQGRFEEDFQAVFDRIEEETGKPVEFSKVNSYAASVEATPSRRCAPNEHTSRTSRPGRRRSRSTWRGRSRSRRASRPTNSSGIGCSRRRAPTPTTSRASLTLPVTT